MRFQRVWSLLGCLCVLFGLGSMAAVAQNLNGSIRGSVLDASGGAVAGTTLTVTSAATGQSIHAVSNSSGRYVIPNLQPGTYTLIASHKGFRDYQRSAVQIAANQDLTINVQLAVGSTEQTVVVSAPASQLNMVNGQRQATISPVVLQKLPLEVSGTLRTAADFISLLPGVTAPQGNAFDVTVNGGMQTGDEATVDGASMQEGLMSQSGEVAASQDFPMTPDMIQEVTVLTGNYGAQYGSTTGAQIIEVTKSGGTSLHGSLFEYNHNSAFNATPFDAFSKPYDNENEFGGTLGGPLAIPWLWPKKKRTFFFLTLEGFRQVGSSNVQYLTVPTAQERQGDFSDWGQPIYDHSQPNPNYNPNLALSANNAPYMQFSCNGKANVICPSRIDPMVAGWLKYLPAPNVAGRVINNYERPGESPSQLVANANYLDLRVDQYLGNSDHAFASVYYQGAHPYTYTELPLQLATNVPASPEYAFVDRFNWDHIFGPSLVNHFVFGYSNRMEGYYSIDGPYANDVPQVPGVPSHAYPPQINLGQYAGFGSNQGPSSENVTARPSAIFNDMATWVTGNHTIVFGGEFRFEAMNIHNFHNQSGTFSFSTAETGVPGLNGGNEFASFLLGNVDSASVNLYSTTTSYPRAYSYALFVNDTWQATPRLSLNYGLRWDYDPPSWELRNNFSFFNPTGANPGANNLPGSLAFAGKSWGAASYGAKYPEQPWHKGFGPRLGFSYALTKSTVVRGGYGIFFDRNFYPGWAGGIAQDGFTSTAVVASPDNGITPAFQLSSGFPNLSSFPHPPFTSASFDNGQSAPIYRPVGANRLPYGQQWNLTVEHQFAGNNMVSVAYVASKGTRLPSQIDGLNELNPAQYLSWGNKLNDTFGPTDTTKDGVSIPYPGWVQQMQACGATVGQALRPYPQYCGNILPENGNDGNSSYNSLQVSAQHHFSHGLWFLTSYTWSKTLADSGSGLVQPSALSWNGVGGGISRFQKSRAKALSYSDIPQSLNLSLSYDLPFGIGRRWLNQSSLLARAVGGWTLSTNYMAVSGTPLPIQFGGGNCDTGTYFQMGCYPALLQGKSPYLQSPGSFNPGAGGAANNSAMLLNPAAFEPASLFTGYYTGQGSPVSSVRAPGYQNQNLSIQKTFQVSERTALKIRADVFNVWNWHFYTCRGGGNNPGCSAFNTDLSSPQFGQWNGNVSNPRNIQLSADFSF